MPYLFLSHEYLVITFAMSRIVATHFFVLFICVLFLCLIYVIQKGNIILSHHTAYSIVDRKHTPSTTVCAGIGSWFLSSSGADSEHCGRFSFEPCKTIEQLITNFYVQPVDKSTMENDYFFHDYLCIVTNSSFHLKPSILVSKLYTRICFPFY